MKQNQKKLTNDYIMKSVVEKHVDMKNSADYSGMRVKVDFGKRPIYDSF